jgi:hypothetical protein
MSDHDIQIPGAFGASLLLPTTTTTPLFCFVLFFIFWCSFFGLFGPSFVSCIVVVFIGDLWLGL